MKIVKLILSMALVLGLIPLQGCEGTDSSGPSFAPSESLNPLYSDREVVFDPALLGDWQMEDGAVFNFEAAGSNGYEIKIEGDQEVYEAHLVRLQDHLFLDLALTRWPGEPGGNEMHLDWQQVGVEFAPKLVRIQDSIYLEVVPGLVDNRGAALKVRIRPAHWFFRLISENGSLRLVSLNKNWLSKALQQGSVNIDHVEVDEEMLLTAKTADLQHLVLEHSADAEAFSGELKLQRKNQ